MASHGRGRRRGAGLRVQPGAAPEGASPRSHPPKTPPGDLSGRLLRDRSLRVPPLSVRLTRPPPQRDRRPALGRRWPAALGSRKGEGSLPDPPGPPVAGGPARRGRLHGQRPPRAAAPASPETRLGPGAPSGVSDVCPRGSCLRGLPPTRRWLESFGSGLVGASSERDRPRPSSGLGPFAGGLCPSNGGRRRLCSGFSSRTRLRVTSERDLRRVPSSRFRPPDPGRSERAGRHPTLRLVAAFAYYYYYYYYYYYFSYYYYYYYCYCDSASPRPRRRVEELAENHERQSQKHAEHVKAFIMYNIIITYIHVYHIIVYYIILHVIVLYDMILYCIIL